MIFARHTPLSQRVLGAVDLAIDLATLGEYGLEPCPADESRRERPGRKTGWEALTTARSRGACDAPVPWTAGSRSVRGRGATPAGRRRIREAA